jgi:hypothetical protein
VGATVIEGKGLFEGSSLRVVYPWSSDALKGQETVEQCETHHVLLQIAVPNNHPDQIEQARRQKTLPTAVTRRSTWRRPRPAVQKLTPGFRDPADGKLRSSIK